MYVPYEITEPGMTGFEPKGKEKSTEKQWVFPRAAPTEKQKRIMVSRAAEIGVRFLFKNFIYKKW